MPAPAPPPALPIDAALPRLLAALAQRNAAVLVAPPGAGKTTRVPLALLDAVVARFGRHVLALAGRGAPAFLHPPRSFRILSA